ncbi:23S rRNA (adenine(2503)-C(2))-methyltransferase RlmN [Atopobium fossor]|uniref:23S rRNA (adenine(2503)-C(2))-methyltransferase RlmN n=1 Tax=Atopobium fossor TaxID=39487 RepID=UPI0003FB1DFD|nr:23S rRNA (adenine(2503)-C(2))-methyltransferase RlmN [Atopobium fossor]
MNTEDTELLSSTDTSPVHTSIRSLSPDELTRALLNMGQPKFRAKQISDWLWVKHATSFDEMSNLPAALREQLTEKFVIGTAEEVARQVSKDGSRKYLLKFIDGAAVECVGMPTKNKLSVCASTQAGCGMGCAFCATGTAGLTRSLTAAEIYDQVAHVAKDFGTRVTSVVLMGQGEPFANYSETLKALRLLNSPEGLGIGARHLTVSTCGIIPMIHKFANEPEQFTLAVSLHSAVQKTRDTIMPGVKRFSLLRLWDAMQEYVEKTGRRPSYEYALIGGVNDTDDELAALCDFASDTMAHVNLIMLNEVPGSPFKPSTDARAQLFVHKLAQIGVECTIRNSRGNDIAAACGQLKQQILS